MIIIMFNHHIFALKINYNVFTVFYENYKNHLIGTRIYKILIY